MYLYSIHLKEVVDEVFGCTENGAVCLLLSHTQEQRTPLVWLNFDPLRATMIGLRREQKSELRTELN